jgi:hypothetical protein
MSIITKRAICLAVIVEVASCIGMIFQTEPLGFWDKLCDSIGWSPFAVSDVLIGLFIVLNFPVVFLAHHLFGSIGIGGYNGRLIFTSLIGPVIVLVQCALWSFVFFGLLHLEKKIRARFRHHDA